MPKRRSNRRHYRRNQRGNKFYHSINMNYAYTISNNKFPLL